MRSKVAVPALCLVLAGCQPTSKLDDLSHVDVCALVGAAQLQALGTQLQTPPQPRPSEGMSAGACHWAFENSSDLPSSPSLDLMVVTPAVAGRNPYLDQWYRASLSEVAVSLGDKGTPVPKLGKQTVLFVSPGSKQVQVWMQQSETYLVFVAHALDPDRVVDMARQVGRSIER